MKTIHRKILTPFIVMIILLPLLVFVMFNIVLAYVFYEDTKEGLETTFDMVQVLIKDELTTISVREGNQDKLKASLESLSKAIRLTSRSQETDIFFMAQNGNYVFPRDFSGAAISREDLQEMYDDRSTVTSNETLEKTIDKKDYLINISSLRLGNTRLKQGVLVMVSPIKTDKALMVQLNVLMLAIVIGAILLAVLMAKRVSKGIAKPIIKASNHAKIIAQGHHQTLELTSNVKEIQTLYTSLNHMSHTLQETKIAQVHYFQNLSHDLRTPLMSIQGYAEGIQAGIFQDSASAAAIIQHESLRLKNLVDQLLTLSKLDSSQGKSQAEKFVVKEMLDEIVTRYRGLSQQENKTLTLNSPDDLILNIDPGLFDKVISNLISNALKYAKHMVVIHVLSLDTGLEITIQDDGPGIDTQAMQDIFQRFHKGKDGNFGLGLAIVASAMDKLGGQVTWKNHSQGALFTLKFDV